MKRRPPSLTPEELLARAMNAVTARSRGIWARRGLASRSRLDPTTQAMLLRQLYLAHFEQERFREALLVSKQSIELGILADVLHQDAARAAALLGDTVEAAKHLRTAARLGPPSRRAFHWWTLGSIFFLSGQFREAAGALQRAARWSTKEKPLYQAHLAVARSLLGERIGNWGELFDRLVAIPAGQGYGQFVLGLVAHYRKRPKEARRHLQAFVERTESLRPATALALRKECEHARALLAEDSGDR